MSNVISDQLGKWFDEFQKIPDETHLLCPKISDEDGENYRSLDEPGSAITREEKEKRIEDGNSRINITYWNSLIFGFDEKDGGKWLKDFSNRLDSSLKSCSECVLNWHMRRKPQMQKFLEHWDEDATAQIQALLERIDNVRIEENLTWAKEYIAKIENTGATFKKSEFGDKLGDVLITVYEALCCMTYMAQPDRRATFQYVFMRLQGKNYLKLGTKDPLPGMTYFLFDHKNDDRRKWAHENWKNITTSSLTAPQFEWAIQDGLANAVEDTWRKDLNQSIPEQYLEIEQFWCGFEDIVRTLPASLIASHVRNLEVSKSIYELLFAHIQFCRSEGVLVVAIRILTLLLEKAPHVIWDVIGGARPNVIADLLFGSPIYKGLLRQSLENCWDSPSQDSVPFSTSWIAPWLKSIGRDQRYDACEVLMHTLFETLVKDDSIGEPGQAACMRAGFDALAFTLNTFLDMETSSATSTVQLYINAAFNLMTKYKDLLIQQINPPKKQKSIEGWATFKVADSAYKLTQAAMKLDMKLFYEEYHAIHGSNKIQSTVTRNSREFWTAIIEMYEASNDRVTLSKHILHALAPICACEQIRVRKGAGKLDESSAAFNESLKMTADTIAKIIGRIGDMDVMDLNSLFIERVPIQVIIGLSVHDESDLAESAAEVIKGWTAEDTRGSAIEQLAQLHTEQTLASAVWALDRVLKPPFPWGPIRPLLNANRSILRGLAEASSGVLRGGQLDSRQAATVLRWWNEQWRFVSKSCLNIETWSHYVPNAIMTEFCREIMELAEALIAEDGLLTSATALGRSEADMMVRILAPAKDNFRGMENMIRLKDLWLVDVTVRVLCKILKRLRENNLEINAGSRKLIVDACVPTATPGKYLRSTNLSDQQRAELLQALGNTDDDVQIIQLSAADAKSARDKTKKQSRLDAWSKSGSSSPSTSTSSSASKPSSNRQDVLDLSKSLSNPLLKTIEAKQKAKAKVPDQKAISALKESRMREKAEKAKRDAEAIAKAKQLRGEPLGGPAGRSEIMVNSSDEESDDSDDADEGNQLALISTDGQKTVDEAEKRRLQALRDMTRRPVKKVRQQRSVKEMRARLIPPMDKLHNAILAWDIFHDGNEPPNGPKACKVDTRYSNPASYRDTFFPLLASEAWRAFVTAKDEVTAQAFGIKIASRASVDSYLEITFTMEVVQNRERGIGEGDILLVSEDESPLNNPTARHCLARVHRLTYKKERVEIIFRVASRGNPLAATLMPNSMMHGIKITNMTTIEREYAALESLQYYDLMDEILKAEPSPILKYGDEKIANYQSNWQLNRGQALSVLGAQENDGFTLIQGPPGTGKTKTIIAMVGALLSEQLAQAPAKGTPVGVPVRPGATAQPAGQRPKKLLVCAPSNAAVDELVTRLKNGIKTTSGKTKTINVLRLGRTDAISAAVKDVTLDELVRVRMQGDSTKDKAKAERDKLHERAGQIKEELLILRPKLDEANEKEDQDYRNRLLRQFDELKREQRDIGKQIEAEKDSGKSVAREVEMKRRQIQQEILNNANVLCATLSGSGHEMFRNLDVEFETVIIDEAAQCVELSALIPLKYGCCKCILVGDPKQLPPTVLSQSAARFGYDQSLFVRMQQNHPKSVHLLDMQYRMHPEISLFPSKEFYEGQLRDGQDMAGLRQQPWHKSALLGPYRFFDVQGVQERGRKGQSLVNTRELDVALQMYDRFRKEYSECNLVGKIGIITPYKAQLFELRSRFKARYGEDITDIIEFNTTDAFQGRECEIIIFSCVRASATGGIGFMTDIRRMNVGLTRAKSSLWILGDSRALVQGEFWKKLIEDAQSRDRYTQGDVVNMFRKPLEKAKPGSIMTSAAPTPADSPMATVSPVATTDGDVSMPDAYEPTPFARSSSSEDRTGMPTRPADHQPRPPVIQTSSFSGDKKRSLNSPDGTPPVPKRIASDRPRGGGLAGKFGQKPNRPVPKQPTDPSAMVTLGLAPPERPPPKPSALPTLPSLPLAPSGPSASGPLETAAHRATEKGQAKLIHAEETMSYPPHLALAKEQQSMLSDGSFRSDFVVPAAAPRATVLSRFYAAVRRLISVLPDSPEKLAVQTEMPAVDIALEQAADRDDVVSRLVLDRIFDPQFTFDTSHADTAAYLLDLTGPLAARTGGGSISASLVERLATVVRSSELRGRPADPSMHAWLFEQWCTLFRSLEPAEAEAMMASGILQRLFGVDLLRAAERKAQLDRRRAVQKYEARIDVANGANAVKLRTRDALSALPRLLSLCEQIHHGEGGGGDPAAAAAAAVVDILDSLMQGLGEVLAVRAAQPPAQRGQQLTFWTHLGVVPALDRARATGDFAQFVTAMREQLVRADAENDLDAFYAIGTEVRRMLECIKARELGRIQQRKGSGGSGGEGPTDKGNEHDKFGDV
ncbi:hypothetical protein V2A60_010286 [Cordyceps javanica]